MSDEMENSKPESEGVPSENKADGNKENSAPQNEAAESRDGKRSIVVGDFPKSEGKISISGDLVVAEFYMTDRLKAIYGFPGWIQDQIKMHFMALDMKNKEQANKIFVPGRPSGNGFVNGVRRMLKH